VNRRDVDRRIPAVLACVLAGSVATAATITNPSFELNAFTNMPGSISSNTLITGWTASDDELAGLNPAGTNYPYADNGAVPNGTNVVYIASPNAGLQTVMTGLETGETYKVGFRMNAAAGDTPSLRASVDGEKIVDMFIYPVNGTAAYRYGAIDFTAAETNQVLALTNFTGAAEHVVLLDDFSIAVSSGAWSYAQWNDDTSSGVDSSRTYTHAYNLGTANGTTVNGVPFTGVAGGNPAVAGRFAMGGFANQYGGPDNNAVTTLGGGSAVIASQFLYNGNPQTLTLYGLAPGTEYVATFYSVAWTDSDMRTHTFSLGNERLTIDQNSFGGRNGIRISCRYVAPADGKIVLSLSPLSIRTFHLYGFSNSREGLSPLITQHPRSQVIAAGNTSYLRAASEGLPGDTYEWQQEGIPLPGETNTVLTLAVTGAAETGDYVFVVTNAYGSVTSDVATLTLGMIANPGFEADSQYTYPGYIGNPGNVPISGWTHSDPQRVGINPLADGTGPFSDNGTIPDGSQVAFIQGTGTQGMSTVVSGLIPGETYTVNLRANRRNSGGVPALRASVDGERVLDAEITSVGGTNPYKYVAFDFTAGAEAQVLAFTNDAAGDTTVLLDDVTIAPSTTGWSYAAWTDDASSGIAPTSSYTHAYNFGSWESPTINGVPFTGIPDLNPSSPGKFSTSGMTQNYHNDVNTLTTSGGGSAALGRDFVYQYNGTLHTITIDGLVTGVTYEATVYGVGFDNLPALRVMTFGVGEDRMTINENAFGNNVGIRISHRYVADASGSITLSYVPLKQPTSFHTYAFSNRELASTQPPVIYTHPEAEQTVYEGATVTFSAQTGGMRPLFHQWRRNGSALAGQTNRTLSLVDVDLNQSGEYTLLVSNALGHVVSSNAMLQVALPIATLFNTGVDDQGALLTDQTVDPHYTLVTSVDPVWPGPDAYAATVIPGSYIASGPDSLWISPRTNLIGNCAVGTFTYRTTFDMTGLNPQDARIEGQWAVDNAGSDIVLNGTSLGLVNTTGYGSYASFTIASGFVPGENILDFVTENVAAVGPTALRVRMSGIAQPSNRGMVLIVR